MCWKSWGNKSTVYYIISGKQQAVASPCPGVDLDDEVSMMLDCSKGVSETEFLIDVRQPLWTD